MNKVAIITGGTSGIGLATAKCFLEHGDKVVIAGRNKERGESALGTLNGGDNASFYACDGSVEEQVKELVEYTVRVYSKLDIMVTAAGAARAMTIDKEDYEGWRKILSTDLDSVFFADRDAILQFQKQNSRGTIVNVSSIAGICGMTTSHGYAAAKAGVANLTRSLGVTYAKDGIRVNAVAPGYVNTPLIAGLPEERVNEMAKLHPIGRFAEPEEIGNAIYFLASDDSSFITGVVLPVDGGYSVI